MTDMMQISNEIFGESCLITCKEVLYSFCKFKKLSKKATTILESIQEPELHEEAAKVLKNFNL